MPQFHPVTKSDLVSAELKNAYWNGHVPRRVDSRRQTFQEGNFRYLSDSGSMNHSGQSSVAGQTRKLRAINGGAETPKRNVTLRTNYLYIGRSI